jgi:hypothetical protein
MGRLVRLNRLLAECAISLETIPSLQHQPLCPIFAEFALLAVAQRLERLNAASLSEEIVGVEHVTQFVPCKTENLVRRQGVDLGHELGADFRGFCCVGPLRDARTTGRGLTKTLHLSANDRKQVYCRFDGLQPERAPIINYSHYA